MKNLFIFLFSLFTLSLSAQTVKEVFSGYGNISAVSGTGPTFNIQVNSFTGSPRFQAYGTWLGSDVQIGDVLWVDCARFVVTGVVGSSFSTMNLNVEVPAMDWGVGVSAPMTNTRCAVVHEFNGIPALPPPADGNAGALSGIDGNLYSCMMSHYSKTVDSLINKATEIALVSGTGIPNATLHTVNGYNFAKNGMGDGDLYEWDGTVFVKNERSGGEPISVKSYAVKNSITPSAAFTSLLAKYLVEGGNLVVDTTINITTNTSTSSLVTIEIAKGGLFNISTGVTLTINGLLNANPSQQIFAWTGTGNVQLNQKIPIVYPYWFGAKNDGSIDDYPSAQKAINVANASDIKVVEFFAGDHPLSKGLLIKEGVFSSLELRGVKSYDGGVAGTQLRMTDTTTFCIGIQGARAVKISGFYIRGWGSTFNPDLGQLITYTNQQFRDQWGRNTRYSPTAGIVIDPFQNGGVPPDGGYPGFTSEYVSGNTLSSNVTIEHCVIRYFIGGIVISPTTATGNGSEININDVHIDRCQYGLTTSQTQSRAVNFTNGVIAQTQVNTDGRTFGNQNGPFPLFANVEFGYCKQILNYNNGGGDGKISNMYCESVWQIGNWSGNFFTLTFDKCEINFTTPPESGVGDPASVLDSGTKINFFGGYIGYSSYRPIECNVKSLNFYGTSLRTYALNKVDGGLNGNGITYDNCRIDGYLGASQADQFRQEQILTDNSQLTPRLAIPGFKIKYPEIGTNDANTAVLEDLKSGQQYVTMIDNPVTITVDHVAHTATWTTTQPGKYRVGDFITSYNNNSTVTPSGSLTACSFGKVASIVGNVITCDNTPLGISSGTYAAYLYEMRYIIPTHRGSITTGTNKLVVTSKATNRTVAQSWPVGSRVTVPGSSMSSGVYTGLYVSSVVADTIFLSGNSGSTFTDVEIYSAPFRTTYYSSDNTYQETGSTYRNVGYRTGDIIFFSSHSYRHSAIVTAGGFTPTVKFLYKPISGTTGARPTPTSLDVNLTYYNTTTSTYEVWNGTTWVSAGADNWGSQTVVTTGSTLSGNGTSGSPLQVANNGINTTQIVDGAITASKLNNMSATSGQVLKYNGSTWAPGSDDVGGGGGATNISITHTPTSVTVNSDSGSDGTMNPADGTNAGVMLPSQFTKLSNISITQPVDLDALETASHAAVTLSGENYLSIAGQVITANPVNLAGTNVTGTLPVNKGGTGQVTTQAAINSLAGAVTSGQYLRGNGTNVVMSAIQVVDVPTLNQNTTGTASNITGILNATSFPALTGDVTTTSGSVVTTIAANAVTSSKIQDGTVTNADIFARAANSVMGRSANTTGTVGDIQATVDGHVLRLSGTTLGFGQVTTAGIGDGAVTMAKIDPASAATGQVIKWNGTAWAPANDNVGSVTTNDLVGTARTSITNGVGAILGTLPVTVDVNESGLNPANIPITDTGNFFPTDNVNAALQSLGTNSHVPVTVVDGSTIDFTLTGQQITAEAQNIGSTQITNGAVANADLANMAGNTVKVNATSLSAAPQDLSIPASTVLGRGIVGDISPLAAGGDLSGAYNNLQIGSGAVGSTEIANGSVANTDLSTMPANTIKGNNTGSTATPVDMTVLQAKTMMGLDLVENTALSTWAGSTNITTLGTIATGTWNATTIGINKGGTGQTTASAAFNALSPITTLGDLIYGSGTNTNSRLGGNTTTTKLFLTQTGTGSASAAPAWGAIVAGDIPTLNQNTTGSAGSISGTNVITNTNLAQAPAKSVKGNFTNATANVSDNAATAADQVLVNNSTNTGLTWGQVQTGGIANDAVTTGKIAPATILPADLANSGATAGTYTNATVTVNAQGLVTSISSGAGGGGDDWGAQSVVTSSEFTGNGVTGTPLTLAQNGATSDQVLKWNGIDWGPANDADGQTIFEDDRDVNTLTLGLSGGNTYVIPSATSSLAGLMSGASLVDITDLTILTGVASNSVNLGTFTGTTIPDNQTIKSALQSLESSLESGSSAVLTPTYITQTPSATLPNEQALSALATGLVKNTTTTGVLSIAVSGTDYAPATSGTSILKGNGSGGFSNAVAGTDYQAPLTNPVTGTGATNQLAYFSSTGVITSSGNLTQSGGNKLILGDYTTAGGLEIRGHQSINAGAQVITASNNRPLSIIAGYSTTTNNTNIDGLYTQVSLSNDGTTTGHQVYGGRITASAAANSSASVVGGLATSSVNFSTNVSGVYGLYSRVDEFAASGSGSDRLAGRFDVFKQSNSVDFGTGTGFSGTVADNTAAGRWLVGYGGTFYVSNAKTAFAANFGTNNTKGADNNVIGAFINTTFSGSGIGGPSMKGIEVNGATNSSSTVTTYYGIHQNSIPSGATTAYAYYNGTAGRVYSLGNVSIGQDLNNAALSVTGSGATSATYAAKFHNSTGTDNLLTIRNDERIGILISSPTATLHTTQTAIASVGAGSGTNAATFFTFTGTQGGNSTATTGTVFAGNAGNGTILLGNGGNATGNPTLGFGGNGGSLDFRAGGGGLANSFGGAGGTATLQAGDGGFGATAGSPGWLKLAAGNAATSTNGNGASIYAAGGAKDGTGLDGPIYLQATPSSNTRAAGVGIGRLTTPAGTLHLGENGRLTGSLAIDGTTAGTYKLTVPSSVTSYTMTMPAAVGTTDQVLVAVDNAGTLGWGNKTADLLGYASENTSGSTFQITGTKTNVVVQSGTSAVILPEIVASAPGSNQVVPSKIICVSNLTSSTITISRGGTSDNLLPGDVTQISLGKNQIAWFQSTNANSWTYLRSTSAMEKEIVTTGSPTISNDVKYFYYDPSSNQTSVTITMPANPNDGDEVNIMFGGQIAVASTVINNLTISPNVGQALYGTAPAASAVGGDSLKYIYRANTAKWYRIIL